MDDGNKAGQAPARAPSPTDEELEAAVRLKTKESLGNLARAVARMVAVDGQSLDGVSVGPSESLARQSWLAGTVDKLGTASSVEEFNSIVAERVGRLVSDFPDMEGGPSRVAFRTLSADAFRKGGELAQGMGPALATGNHLGSYADCDPVAALDAKKRMAVELSLAKRTARLAAESGVGKAEEGLAKQKARLMERFGFKEMSMEGAPKSPASQSFLLAELERQLAKGAKELGLASEKAVGMDGRWSLRVIDEVSNTQLLGTGAYVTTASAEPTLALPINAQTPELLRHEWTHMLDLRLGDLLKEKVLSGVDELEAHVRKNALGEVFFSRMPVEAQKLMPEAYQGYWEVAAASQGLGEGDELRGIAAERSKKLESLAGRMEGALLSNPHDLAGLDEAARAELSEDMKGPIKFLMTQPALARALQAGQEMDFGAEAAKAPGEGIDVALGELGKKLEEKFGLAWRTDGNGVEIPARDHLVASLNDASMGMEAAAVRELSLMAGNDGMPLNQKSGFAKSSLLLDERMGGKGYWDSAHEMLARAIGRPSSLFARVDALAELRAKKGSYWGAANVDLAAQRLSDESYAPQLGAGGQKMVSEGFAKMTAAAGLGSARLEMGAREWAERVLASKAGTTLLSKVSVAMDAMQRVDLAADRVFHAVVGDAKRVVASMSAAPGKMLHGLGAVAAFGAYASGMEAAKEAKQGHAGQAVIQGGAAVGSTVVAAGSVAGLAGVARAAQLTRMAGPLGALLGYAGAAATAAKAVGASEAGADAESGRLWKSAGIKAAGATGSIAAGAVAGAAIGSAFPVAGTVVGAAVGMVVAYGAERWAQAVEAAPIEPRIPDMGSKLAQRRARVAVEAGPAGPAVGKGPGM